MTPPMRSTVDNAHDEIRQLYHNTTPATVERDLRRAITLLKSLPTEKERLPVAGYMDGLSQLRSEWLLARRRSKAKSAQPAAGRKRRKK